MKYFVTGIPGSGARIMIAALAQSGIKLYSEEAIDRSHRAMIYRKTGKRSRDKMSFYSFDSKKMSQRPQSSVDKKLDDHIALICPPFLESMLSRLNEKYAKIIWIKRSFSDCQASFKKIFGYDMDSDLWRESLKSMDSLKEKYDVVEIEFKDMMTNPRGQLEFLIESGFPIKYFDLAIKEFVEKKSQIAWI